MATLDQIIKVQTNRSGAVDDVYLRLSGDTSGTAPALPANFRISSTVEGTANAPIFTAADMAAAITMRDAANANASPWHQGDLAVLNVGDATNIDELYVFISADQTTASRGATTAADWQQVGSGASGGGGGGIRQIAADTVPAGMLPAVPAEELVGTHVYQPQSATQAPRIWILGSDRAYRELLAQGTGQFVNVVEGTGATQVVREGAAETQVVREGAGATQVVREGAGETQVVREGQDNMGTGVLRYSNFDTSAGGDFTNTAGQLAINFPDMINFATTHTTSFAATGPGLDQAMLRAATYTPAIATGAGGGWHVGDVLVATFTTPDPDEVETYIFTGTEGTATADLVVGDFVHITSNGIQEIAGLTGATISQQQLIDAGVALTGNEVDALPFANTAARNAATMIAWKQGDLAVIAGTPVETYTFVGTTQTTAAVTTDADWKRVGVNVDDIENVNELNTLTANEGDWAFISPEHLTTATGQAFVYGLNSGSSIVDTTHDVLATTTTSITTRGDATTLIANGDMLSPNSDGSGGIPVSADPTYDGTLVDTNVDTTAATGQTFNIAAQPNPAIAVGELVNTSATGPGVEVTAVGTAVGAASQINVGATPRWLSNIQTTTTTGPGVFQRVANLANQNVIYLPGATTNIPTTGDYVSYDDSGTTRSARVIATFNSQISGNLTPTANFNLQQFVGTAANSIYESNGNPPSNGDTSFFIRPANNTVLADWFNNRREVLFEYPSLPGVIWQLSPTSATNNNVRIGMVSGWIQLPGAATAAQYQQALYNAGVGNGTQRVTLYANDANFGSRNALRLDVTDTLPNGNPFTNVNGVQTQALSRVAAVPQITVAGTNPFNAAGQSIFRAPNITTIPFADASDPEVLFTAGDDIFEQTLAANAWAQVAIEGSGDEEIIRRGDLSDDIGFTSHVLSVTPTAGAAGLASRTIEPATVSPALTDFPTDPQDMFVYLGGMKLVPFVTGRDAANFDYTITNGDLVLSDRTNITSVGTALLEVVVRNVS